MACEKDVDAKWAMVGAMVVVSMLAKAYVKGEDPTSARVCAMVVVSM